MSERKNKFLKTNENEETKYENLQKTAKFQKSIKSRISSIKTKIRMKNHYQDLQIIGKRNLTESGIKR